MNQVEDAYFVINMIKHNGAVVEAYDYEFEIDEVRVITFETDYHTSIRLLWKDWRIKQ